MPQIAPWKARLPTPVFARQFAVVRQVSDGFFLPALRLVEAGEVVVAIGEAGVFGERTLVGLRSLVWAAGVFQQDAEVVVQQGVAAACGETRAIDAFGLVEAAVFMEQPTEVGRGAGVRRVGGERLFIGVLCRFAIQCLEDRPAAKPVLGQGFRRFAAVG